MTLRGSSKQAVQLIEEYLGTPLNSNPSDMYRQISINCPVVSEGDTCTVGTEYQTQTVYRVGTHYVRVSVSREDDNSWITDPNSFSEVFPVRVMQTRYKTLEEINNR